MAHRRDEHQVELGGVDSRAIQALEAASEARA